MDNPLKALASVLSVYMLYPFGLIPFQFIIIQGYVFVILVVFESNNCSSH